MSENPIEIQVDASKMYMDDLYFMMPNEDGNATQMKGTLEMLERVVVGGIKGKKIPLLAMGDIFDKIKDALNEASDPNDSSSD